MPKITIYVSKSVKEQVVKFDRDQREQLGVKLRSLIRRELAKTEKE